MKNTPEGKGIKYVAFLRGINVGGHTQIKMEELRKALGPIGFRNVRTVLASGNVLFEAPAADPAALSRDISQKLRGALGREVAVIVRPVDGLLELEARRPFKDFEADPEARLLVTFYPGHRDFAGLPAQEGFRVLSASDGAICSVLYDRTNASTPLLMGAIEKELGHGVTTRTWGTILRILKAGG